MNYVLFAKMDQQKQTLKKYWENGKKQECIPVGCIPPALYHMGGSLSGRLPPL